MNDFIRILIFERKTLLKGWVISTLVVFPFTFLPVITQHGFTFDAIRNRFSESVLYSLGFAMVIVIAAVIHNYNHLVDRKRIFDMHTFTALNFLGRIDGSGSLVKELETFLLGKIGEYYFRINIIEPESKTIIVQIVPLIETEENSLLEKQLKLELGFKNNWFFGKEIELSEEQLHNPKFLKGVLFKLEKDLRRLGVQPLDVSESELNEE